jgi:sigma-E factor negative regulatory protein RseC
MQKSADCHTVKNIREESEMKSTSMMHTRGLVAEIDKNGDAFVIMDRKNACGGCGSAKTDACKTCLSGSKIQARVLNSEHAQKGDIVSVSLNTSKVLKGAAALYLIPVAGVLLGVFVGAGFHGAFAVSETIASIVAGFIGLVVGFSIVKLISNRMAADEGMTPKISKIIFSSSDGRTIY